MDSQPPASPAPAGRTKPERAGGLSSVSNAIRILKCFSDSEAEIGTTALAKRLGTSKSTIHRLASTLVAEGLLEQNPQTERYRLGITLFELGTLVRQRMDVSTEGRQPLIDLREATNETVHLAIRNGRDVIYVYALEGKQAIRIRSNLGDRKPAFCTAEGLSILAFEPPETVRALAAAGFSARTPHSIKNADELLRALEAIRETGFALEVEQCEIGMRSIAAPIWDSGQHVVAAVGMAGPLQRLSDEAVAKYIPLVVETARVISRRLGCNTGNTPPRSV